MTEQLADLLRARLEALPLTDRLVGLTRPYETKVPNGDDLRTVRFPVPVSFTAAECENDPRYLVPDAATASICYFEDRGTVMDNQQGVSAGWRSILRLVGWVNPAHFNGPITDVALLTTLLQALQVNRRGSSGAFLDLLVTATALPADSSLFAGYTYETPLLYPPYRLVGLELTCAYRLAPACDLAFPERLTYDPAIC